MSVPPQVAAFAPGRFRLLLLSLVLFFGGTAASTGASREGLIEVILLAFFIVAAVLDLREPGRRRGFSIALAATVILWSFLDLNLPIRLPVVAGTLVALFAGFVVWRTFTAVMRPQRPVSDRIVGAVCVYVLIGLGWAKVYETLDGVAPGSFRFPADAGWTAAGPLRYTYFSFVTLATLGYGDVTPLTALAGTLAWMEAIFGQLYLAITVARLVALSLAERAGPDRGSRALLVALRAASGSTPPLPRRSPRRPRWCRQPRSPGGARPGTPRARSDRPGSHRPSGSVHRSSG